MIRCNFNQLVNISINLLTSAGASQKEAEIVGNSLAKANLFGVDSHGIIRLPEYIDMIETDIIKLKTEMKLVRDTSCTSLINGNWGFGQVIASSAMEKAIRKAEKTMISAISIFNCNHVGRLADYTMMAAKKDMIGLMTVNSDPVVAPFGGRSAVLGTNPLSVSIPTGSGIPILIDFATAIVSEGKVREALLRGDVIPEGWILDSFGRPTTKPQDLYRPPLPPLQTEILGALLPFGGHKGYGLNLLVDILSGALTGAGCDGEITKGNGVFLMAINLEGFLSPKEFKDRVDRLIDTIKSSPKAVGVEEILIPGEPEFKIKEKRIKEGIIIPGKIWEKIIGLYEKYNLNIPDLTLN